MEPFYVAAGFAMYLNRRVELEAWDIEQEFRRAFARVGCWPRAVSRRSCCCWRATRAPAAVAQPAPRAPTTPRSRARIEQVKTDPNLATERTIKTLQWKDSGCAAEPEAGLARMGAGLLPLARSIGARAGLGRRRGARGHARRSTSSAPCARGSPPRRTARSRRPRTCRISTSGPRACRRTSARRHAQLWDRGEHRAALALLYRGLLSRLAHVHQLPMRDSSTEGDCLALSRAHRRARAVEYAARLIVLWQAAVYGHFEADTPAVHALCDGFAPALDRAACPEPRREPPHDRVDRGAGPCRSLLLVYWIASNTYWADTIGPAAAQGRGRHQSLLRGAALRRSARRARRRAIACSRVPAVRRRHRPLDVELEPEHAAPRGARTVGRVGRPPGRGRHGGRGPGVRALVGHPGRRTAAAAGRDEERRRPPGPCFSFLEERRAGQSRAFERPALALRDRSGVRGWPRAAPSNGRSTSRASAGRRCGCRSDAAASP